MRPTNGGFLVLFARTARSHAAFDEFIFSAVDSARLIGLLIFVDLPEWVANSTCGYRGLRYCREVRGLLLLLYRNGHVGVNRIVSKMPVMVSRNVFEKRNVGEYRSLSNVTLKRCNGAPLSLFHQIPGKVRFCWQLIKIEFQSAVCKVWSVFELFWHPWCFDFCVYTRLKMDSEKLKIRAFRVQRV